MEEESELAGKVALVTGGARNIGRAIALELARGGAAVLVNARSSRAEAEQTVAADPRGGRPRGAACSPTSPTRRRSPRWWQPASKEFGRLDMLVNNAAVRAETPFADMTFDEWRRVLCYHPRRLLPLRAGLPAAPGARGRRQRSSTSAA